MTLPLEFDTYEHNIKLLIDIRQQFISNLILMSNHFEKKKKQFWAFSCGPYRAQWWDVFNSSRQQSLPNLILV